MNEIIAKEGLQVLGEADKSINLDFELKDWPLTASVFFVCATCCFIEWVKHTKGVQQTVVMEE